MTRKKAQELLLWQKDITNGALLLGLFNTTNIADFANGTAFICISQVLRSL